MKAAAPSGILSFRGRCALWWIALNLPFVLGYPGLPWGAWPFLRSITVNLILFVIPGWAVIGWPCRRDCCIPWALLAAMSASFALFFALLALFYVAGWPLTAVAMWQATWFVTVLLAALRTLVAFDVLPVIRTNEMSRESAASHAVETAERPLAGGAWLTASALFAASYGLYFHAATHVVPPQPDHDLEVQGTGYALLNRLEPLLLTDRGPHYYFAHPLLLHFYAGGSFLYFDHLEQLRFYDEASQRVRAIRRGEVITPPPAQLGPLRVVGLAGQDYLLQAPGATPIRSPVEEVEIELIDSYFAMQPGLLETRTPSIFLAALTVGLLAWWAAGVSGQWWMGVLAAAVYATSPEVYVRSSYGGYFAVSNLLVLGMLMAAAAWDARRDSRCAGWACLLAGLLAGLANHKLVLLPVAFAGVTFWRQLRMGGPWRNGVHPLLAGFALGTGLFWVHGLLVDAAAFWKEHVRTHLVDRVVHVNPLGYGGYPTVTGLWSEFSQHTGSLLLPLGLLSLLPALSARRHRSFDLLSDPVAVGLPPGTLRTWVVWMALTAGVYSLVDWRMTKHLSPLLVPLCMAPAAWSVWGWLTRGLVTAVFVGLFVWNLAMLGSLMSDFDAFTITPAW